ncbi:MAG: glycosyltransferase [Patescibacteria group bacterium]|jgi:glycosyltransferase involved in cell wall biosynthesis
MKPFDLVMLNMSSFQEWQSGVVNRNYHVLKMLLRRPEVHRIFAIDYLPLTLKRSIRAYLETLMFGVKGKLLYQDFSSRLVRMDRSIMGDYPGKLFVYSTVDSAFSESVTRRNIQRRLKSLKFDQPALWSYLPLFGRLFTELPASLRVFDAVDDWTAHPWMAQWRGRLETNYRTISNRADVVFTVANELRDRFDHQPKVHWIPNGVDFEHWQNHGPFPDDLTGIPAPIVGYVGVIQNRIDSELIQQLAERNPAKSFVFIGNVYSDFNKSVFDHCPNVHFLGQKTYAELPSYVNRFHVCMIPHRIDPFTRSMNPLKLYEYLACGLPVISTPVSGMSMFGDLVRLAKDAGSFSEQIDLALSEDSERLRLQRKAAMRSHTWHQRVDRMMEIVEATMLNKLAGQAVNCPDGAAADNLVK